MDSGQEVGEARGGACPSGDPYQINQGIERDTAVPDWATQVHTFADEVAEGAQ